MEYQEILKACQKDIDRGSKLPSFKSLKHGNKYNYINGLGKKYGYEQMSSEEPEMATFLYNYIKELLSDPKPESQIMKSPTLFENESLETVKLINRYDQDSITKDIEDIISKEFKNINIVRISDTGSGTMYNVELRMELKSESNINMEQKRFQIAQNLSSFKNKFTSALSAKMPIINVNTGSYQFTKNSDDLTFGLTIALSHTNDREWVSGVYRGKGKIKEAAASIKHIIKAVSLETAIAEFKAGNVDINMLETAIKACGRSELELFVLKYLGIKIPKQPKEEEETKETEINK